MEEFKYLILCNLREAYQLFKCRCPESNIGLSKYCELQPKESIPAGGCGTNMVGVCPIHQNVKLMIIIGTFCNILSREDKKKKFKEL